jgi:hypothetical protein
VRALLTYMEELTLLRVLVGTEGLYLALDPSASAREVTDAVEDALDVTGG